jgi:hypothetical protein
VDPAIMRKPPRKKDEPIITKQLLYRVLFSASIIVVGTLLIYILSLSDDHMSRREQTMVSSVCWSLQDDVEDVLQTDFHLFRIPRPCVCYSEPGAGLRVHTEQDATDDGVGVVCGATCTNLCAGDAGGVSDGGPDSKGPVHAVCIGWNINGTARVPTEV